MPATVPWYCSQIKGVGETAITIVVTSARRGAQEIDVPKSIFSCDPGAEYVAVQSTLWQQKMEVSPSAEKHQFISSLNGRRFIDPSQIKN